MSEYRQNLTTGQWTVIATERAGRPEDFLKPQADENSRLNQPAHSDLCPFCRGGDIERARASVERLDCDGNWLLKIVPNKYASLSRNGSPKLIPHGLFTKGDGYGVSDVVVESPLHNTHLALMKPDEISLVFGAMQERFLQLLEDPAIRIINLFRNHGVRAGASLAHPHAQMIATSIAPPHILNQVHYAKKWHASNGQCVYCTALAEELSQKERIIVETEHFVAWAPFASRSPFETRIQPKRHLSIFGQISAEEVGDFGHILREVLGKIYTALGDPDYNYILRSALVGGNGDHDRADLPYYHWYMVIIPKISRAAGMEIGTGIYINPVAPEAAASILRSAEPPSLAV